MSILNKFTGKKVLEEQEIFEKLDLQLQESKDKKVYFWGASNFLKKYLNNTNHNYTNIQGIIDSNPSKSGKRSVDI